MNIISIINNKGGVGKTTSACHVASALARRGKQVGVIDFDAQANLSSTITYHEPCVDVRTALVNQEPLTKEDFAVTALDNFYLLPNHGNTTSKLFSEFEVFEQTNLLSDILKDNIFDYLVIDTPPSLDLQTYNAIVASHFILIPVEYEIFSVSGLRKIFKTIEQINKRGFSDAEVIGVFVTKVDRRQSLNEKVQAKLDRDFKDKLLTSVIRVNADFKKAQIKRMDAWSYGDKKGAEDYDNLLTEILTKIDA